MRVLVLPVLATAIVLASCARTHIENVEFLSAEPAVRVAYETPAATTPGIKTPSVTAIALPDVRPRPKSTATNPRVITVATVSPNAALIEEPQPERAVRDTDVVKFGTLTADTVRPERRRVMRPQHRPGSVETAFDGTKPRARPRNLDTTAVASAADSVVQPAPRPADLAPAETVQVAAVATAPVVKQPEALKVPTPIIVPNKPATTGNPCTRRLASGIPPRRGSSPAGSKVINAAMALSGDERDRYIEREIRKGNVPDFIRRLAPVVFTGQARNGTAINIVVCVTPDYLAVGNDRDYVRVPMGLPAAARIAAATGFLLPTTKIVDGIYAQAGLRLSPRPMQAGSQMSSTDYFWRHNATVDGQLSAARMKYRDILVAGQKKDLVISNVLRRSPNRVAIYGWHRGNGAPIQPLSTVHGESYADYSHGIRLISKTAFVNGKAMPLSRLLEDPVMAGILSKEGPIQRTDNLMASLSR